MANIKHDEEVKGLVQILSASSIIGNTVSTKRLEALESLLEDNAKLVNENKKMSKALKDIHTRLWNLRPSSYVIDIAEIEEIVSEYK